MAYHYDEEVKEEEMSRTYGMHRFLAFGYRSRGLGSILGATRYSEK
jgi:hypothetical protein